MFGLAVVSCPPLGWGLVRLGAAWPLCSRKEVWSWPFSAATCALTSFLPECLEALGQSREEPTRPKLEDGLWPLATWGPDLAPPLLPLPLASAPLIFYFSP